MHIPTTDTPGSGTPRVPRIAMWTVAVVLAALQAFAYRHTMNPDGLSYLDSARAFAAGDLATGLNPHWGPLYPALIAIGFRILRPDIGTLVPVVHAVSFCLFIVALAAFDFFLRELLRERRDDTAPLVLFGYAVFTYTALALTGLELITPDLAVMASVFAAAGLMLRMRRSGMGLGTAALLGLALALGYFAKSVMFVLGLAFIGSLVFLPSAGPRRWRTIAASAGVFLGFASLLVIPFSRETGTLTFGTAGKLAYNWEVNRVPYTNWQGDARSPLQHPPRQVRSAPDMFEYTRHLQGTYPPWFDPAYWNAGVTTALRAKSQLVQLGRSADFYIGLFFGSAGAIATLLMLWTWGRHARDQLALLLPSLAALALYAPVHLESRYVAPFAALLWLVPVAAARPAPGQARPLARATTLAALLLVGPMVFYSMSRLWHRLDDRNPHPVVAAELRRLGLEPGDRVANIGVTRGENFGSSFESYWAYLAGVQIVAEIPAQKDFICRDSALTEQVLGELAAVGARAVVTRAIPAAACTTGWQAIDGTDFYVRTLQPTAAAAAAARSANTK